MLGLVVTDSDEAQTIDTKINTAGRSGVLDSMRCFQRGLKQPNCKMFKAKTPKTQGQSHNKDTSRFPKQLRGQCALLTLDEIIFKVTTTKDKENHCQNLARRHFGTYKKIPI